MKGRNQEIFLLTWPLKKLVWDVLVAVSTSHKCLETVRAGVTCVTPQSCQVQITPVNLIVLPLHILKQCHYTAVLIAWTSESHSVLLCFVSPVCTVRLRPQPEPRLFIQQWDLAVVTVVATHLALRRVEVGGVGEGGREGVIVRGGVGVAGRGKQRLGIRLGRGRRRVVVLVLACRGSAAVA